jgi:hypothetical protein
MMYVLLMMEWSSCNVVYIYYIVLFFYAIQSSDEFQGRGWLVLVQFTGKFFNSTDRRRFCRRLAKKADGRGMNENA